MHARTGVREAIACWKAKNAIGCTLPSAAILLTLMEPSAHLDVRWTCWAPNLRKWLSSRDISIRSGEAEQPFQDKAVSRYSTRLLRSRSSRMPIS